MQSLLRDFFEANINIAPLVIITNLVVSFILGLLISVFYRKTHKGLSYSQSFVLTIIYITVITSVVIMVIGNSLARAFALVGALSIIRFRTVIKDTKDIAVIFLSLVVGLGVGTNNYFLAVITTIFMCLVMLILFKINYGVLKGSEFILRFYYDRSSREEEYLDLLNSGTKYLNLLHMEPTEDGKKVHLTYDVSLKEGREAKDIISRLSKIEGIEDVVLVSSKSDIDY
jgi:uncharacterized membrane protein YhiD involved in acid resistance